MKFWFRKNINPLIKPDIFVPDDREPYYQELDKLLASKKIHIPIPQTFVETQVWNPRGHTLSHRQTRGKSWTRNAYNACLSLMAIKDADDATFQGGSLNIKTTAGTTRSGNAIAIDTTGSQDSVGDGFLAGAGNDNYGIQVGSNNTAESFEDYVLNTKIASGEGAGQLSYSASQSHDEDYNGGTLVYTITHARYFNNNESGAGSVAVEEAALVGYVNTAGTIDQYVLFSRDLTTTLSVPYQGQLKVTYAIALTYSA